MDNNFNTNMNSDFNSSFNDTNPPEKDGNFSRGVAIGAVFAIFGCMFMFMLLHFLTGGSNDSNNQNQSWGNLGNITDDKGNAIFSDQDMQKLLTIQEWINTYSYYEQDKEAFKEAVYNALLESLDDDYAVYYDKETYASMMQSSAGTYSGIGCVVTQDVNTGEVIVLQPYKGSPAYEAGLAIGDILLKVDDMELTGMDLNEAVSYIKGDEGTSVKVTYKRDGKVYEVDVVRRKVEIPTVESEMLDGNIGYILITSFDEVTVTQFEKAVNDLLNQGAEGFIFDVRSNPGGLLDSVVEMLDMLLPEGTLVYTEDKYGNRDVESSDEQCLEIPMAVLINGDSASASEIFAGALQDYDAAEIIGTQSFGKGIVQSVIPLSDGSGIKFTIASYFTPSGVCIHDIGITPDKVVELPENEDAYDESGYLKDEYDTQLQEAVKYIKDKIK